jgi:ribonucleoside-triphosphate reductase (formate)
VLVVVTPILQWTESIEHSAHQSIGQIRLGVIQLVVIYTENGMCRPFEKQRVIDSLMKEAGLEEKEAKKIARKVERALEKLGYETTTGSLVRGLAVDSLRYFGMHEAVAKYAPLTLSLHDAIKMDGGSEDSDNANLMASPETSHKMKADTIAKKQALRLLPPEVADSHRTGDIHIHDLEYFTTRPFCKSHDIRYFYKYGFIPDGTGLGASAAGPAKHAEVAILQAVKVLGMAQTQYAGGQGLLHFLTFFSPYMDRMSYKDIKQLMQMMVYELNQMYVSRGGQPVFSSVNLTPGIPEVFKKAPAIYNGKVSDRHYEEFEFKVRLAFKAILEVMNEGDYYGRPFPFPKLEVCLQKEFMDPNTWEETYIDNGEIIPSYKALYQAAFNLAAKTGLPYFDNLLPEYRKADGTVACYQCCSFSFSDDSEEGTTEFEDKINFKDGAHFDLGGLQVVSLNLPRCAYKAEHNTEKLWDEIRSLMETAAQVFLLKREAIRKVESRLSFALQHPGDAPAYTVLDNQVFEIGIVGLADMVEYHTGKKTIDSEEAREFAREIIAYMGLVSKGLSYKHGIKTVVARTPAETTQQRFAVLDMLKGYTTEVMHGDIDAARAQLNDTGDLPVYYSNGVAAWFGEDATVYQRIKAEDDLWPALEGGSINHIFLGELTTDGEALMKFALNMARKTNIGYFTFTKDMTQCEECRHMEGGIHDTCNNCHSDRVETYSRITGYISPTSRWNKGKAQELKDRTRFSV